MCYHHVTGTMPSITERRKYMPEFLQKPFLASGSVIPYGILEQQLKEAKEKEALRQQRKHDFLIATYGIVGSIISAVISSLIVLWMQGLL